jgi:hypothetical protein
LGDEIKKNEMGGACSTYGGKRRGVYWVLVRRPDGKRSLGRPRRRSKLDIKTDLQETGWKTRTGLLCLRIWTGAGGL